ncbi:FAD-dependent 5-carboxymethylaminomethyl-2-thiouridine(34) oxidoreductase MnmC [Chitinasiproducens palmae]|uniref:FAD-dependent 5-carboxymethylaminomethyl-2-thiouridine(34) oxidoreductase MnmC n=1 Tax=Chitinasiproducens palmae TaxID=1770053 RepID=UPI001B8C08D9|nr:FAD-dependent 5-carboxymethylaminomethyl-2-thiouridine(34) oxidoreductase MnmC [Chitinasiproducens palmae]
MTNSEFSPSPPAPHALDGIASRGADCFLSALRAWRQQARRAITILDVSVDGPPGNGLDGALAWLAAEHARPAWTTVAPDGGSVPPPPVLHYVVAVSDDLPASAWQALDVRIRTTFARPDADAARRAPPRRGDASAHHNQAAALRLALPGLHRFASDSGHLTLTIATGKQPEMTGALRLRADLILLTGRAPVSPALARALARLADEDAVLSAATLDAASHDALQAAGFAFARQHGAATVGPAGKSAVTPALTSEVTPELMPVVMPLLARFAPRWRVRRHPPPRPVATAPAATDRGPTEPDREQGVDESASARDRPDRPWRTVRRGRAIVIGAGVAGTALTERLAATGWDVQLFERDRSVGQGASGNPAGVFHPALALAETPLTRLSRAAFALALQRWPALVRHGLEWHPDGLIQLDPDGTLLAACQRLGWDPALVASLDAQAASSLLGVPVAGSSIYLREAGWLAPASLCQANVAAAGLRAQLQLGVQVAALRQSPFGSWQAFDPAGQCLATADVALIANAGDAARLLEPPNAPVEAFRGQISRFEVGPAPRLPLIGEGYVSACEGGFIAGASYARGDDTSITLADHLGNLSRAAGLSPAFGALAADDIAGGRAGVRSTVSDHLPMIGQIADLHAARRAAERLQGARLADIPRCPGLYGAYAFGSRGLLWSVLAAEAIVALLDGSPAPVEAPLLDAIDPARFAVRALRNRSL